MERVTQLNGAMPTPIVGRTRNYEGHKVFPYLVGGLVMLAVARPSAVEAIYERLVAALATVGRYLLQLL